ncbi:MAG: trypsin-like peptidase domain-containing protein [Chloracidobacterium sp.]|nr:trypsin-like peptidase domain-containing protein [Chloracidobacterium sp.]
MKIRMIPLLLIFGLTFSIFANAQTKRSNAKSRVFSPQQIAVKVLPSVVIIVTEDENGQPLSQGSGFIYKPGLVVSNLHVFERATNAFVKNVKTGEISKAIEVVAMNASQDICIIRIDNTKFPVLTLGNSHTVRTGDEIYVAQSKGIGRLVYKRNRK